MFRIDNIKENNDLVIFFKIIEKKYIKNFQKDGQVYFGLLEDYRKMEKNGQQNIGDSYEASLTKQVQIYISITDSEYEEVHGHNEGINLRINANQCVFCFYALGLKCFDKESETKFSHVIPTDLLEDICNDKGGMENCAIMIFDNKFVHSIIDEIKNRKLSFMSKKVSYDDYDYIPEFDIHSKEYSLECCFHKREKYKYQNEFRIAVLNTENAPINDLYVNVESAQLQFIELKKGYDFRCDINVDAHEKGKFCDVELDIICSLNETSSSKDPNKS